MRRASNTAWQLMAALMKMQYEICKEQGTTMGHCCLIINKIVVYLHLRRQQRDNLNVFFNASIGTEEDLQEPY